MPQGTVKSYDHERRIAVLVDDSLAEIPVGPDTIAASGLLELRLGQRVRYEVEPGDDGKVVNLNVISL
jgi:cold shock CspA family protein